jgi:YidC/Oxa1 family membrane protein insertase
MDKNLITAVALSIGIYALWFGFVEKRYVKRPPVVSTQTAIPTAAPTPAAPRPTPASSATAARPESAAPSLAEREALESGSVTIATKVSELRIHPLGAAVVSCRYRGPLGPVELVADPRPGLFATWPEARFAFRGEQGGTYRFEAKLPGGLLAIKEFVAGQDDVLPRIRVSLLNPTGKTQDSGAWSLSIGPGLGTVPQEQKENKSVWRALGLQVAAQGLKGKIESFKPGAHAGPYRWVGIDNRYFLAAALPDFSLFEPVESAAPPEVTLRAKNVALAPKSQAVWEIPYYLGAKSAAQLTRYHAGLERSIDFGFFAQLGRLVLRVLGRIQRTVGNWGWAIVLMTFLIQALLFPLTYKSMKAMAVMKKLQPEIARLQQKYAKEPQRLNAEMMDLYRKSGANPLGGCLPLLLQMPIFIALFNALRNSWDLHGAPWILWVHDLSAKDPYYALPVVMGAVMFLQNRMNPAAPSDPTQKTMMTWMPVIFTFFFLSTPAGLVLYWLTSSIISAGIQLALRPHFEKA